MPADGTLAASGAAVSIRRASEADLPSIQAFLREAYGRLAPYKAEPRWLWQFSSNPVRLSQQDGVSPVWIAVSAGRVVGQIAVQSGRFQVGGTVHTGGWIVDVMILPAFRGLGLGHRLYEDVARDVPLLLMLTMAPATRRMAEAAGAVTLRPAVQFSRLAHVLADDVRRHVQQRLEARPRLLLAARLGCRWLRMHDAIAACARAADVFRGRLPRHEPGAPAIEEVDAFDAEVDAFWHRVSAGIAAAAVRDSAFLNWRFRACPDLQYRCFLARRDGVMAGYSVLRQTGPGERRQGIISDILVADGDTITYRALVLHGIRLFGRDVATVECVTSRADMAAVLARLGFYRTRVTAGTASAVDGGLIAKVGALRDGWYFTKGDHDWDQVNLAPLGDM